MSQGGFYYHPFQWEISIMNFMGQEFYDKKKVENIDLLQTKEFYGSSPS